jgi:uncharacterized protein (DUF849 family)
MNPEVFITCAVTGDDTKVTENPHCAVTPEQIAATAIAAAGAGAAIVHIHVRDPDTGDFSMETRHYREVVKRIRESKTDVIVNLTSAWVATSSWVKAGWQIRLRRAATS